MGGNARACQSIESGEGDYLMFIVVEGLDGVGKSTVAKSLSYALGAVHLSTPSNEFDELREPLERAYFECDHARQLFYASTVVGVAEKVRGLLSNEEKVVVDRYWLSTQVYHNWKCNAEHFELPEVAEHLLVPDMTLYLELPLEERKNRILSRDSSNKEDALTLTNIDNESLSGLYQNYSQNKIVGQWLKIDARLEVDDIVKLVKKELYNIQY